VKSADLTPRGSFRCLELTKSVITAELMRCPAPTSLVPEGGTVGSRQQKLKSKGYANRNLAIHGRHLV
jgi:hypothetical protein